MASVDLVFQGAPLTTGDLVFGDDGSSGVSDALLTGFITLARPTLSGSAVVGVGLAGAITLMRPTLSGEVRYFTDTQRPLVATAAVRWQDGLDQLAAVDQHWADSRAQPAAVEARWQQAVHVFGSSEIAWRDGDRRQREAFTARYQDGRRVHTGQEQGYRDAQRAYRPALGVRWQSGVRVQRGLVARFQDGTRGIAGEQHTRYQDARPLQAGFRSVVGSGLGIVRGWSTRYQDAAAPRPGRTHLGPPIVPPGDPCYTPSGDLVFEMPWSADTNLVFVCDAHGAGPDPDPETVIVPIRRIYTVINSATLRRVVGDVLIPTTAMSLAIDTESWTWGFTANVPAAALPDLEPVGGEPVEVEAIINGVAYRALVTGIKRDRKFVRSRLSITGRGRATVLDSPYSPTMTFGNPSNDRTVQQLANDVLTLNGVSLGWDVDTGWEPDDWLVPAGAWSFQGSYMAALNAIAAAAGAYVQPHRTAKALSVLRRYPVAPWDWGDVTPDFELPADVVENEGIDWVDKAIYNRVFVRGMRSGILGQVTRSGTAGDLEAPMVADQLITSAIGARQRALPVLADVGRQALVSLRMPVLAETGIIPPGKFVRYVDGGLTRIGLVRSVSAEVQRAERKLTVWQTIGVETHVGV